MPQKTHKTAIVIIPPTEIWPPIQEIRAEYDSQVKRWMPHINLIYPFRPYSELEELCKSISDKCQSFESFQLNLNKFNYFSHKGGRFTIWLEPEPSQPLQQLQYQLWQIVPNCDDVRKYKNGFTPHLSVGQINGRQNLEKIIKSLQQNWEPLQFRVKAVSIIWRNLPPNDVFQIYSNCFLNSGKVKKIT